jgi:hypothetical protein
MPLDRLIPGAAYRLDYSDDAADVTTTRCRLVLDSPEPVSGAGTRVTKDYLPGGGSSTGVTTNGTGIGSSIRFLLSPEDTATMGIASGVWSVYVLVGTLASQTPVLPAISKLLLVEVPPQGVLPYA